MSGEGVWAEVAVAVCILLLLAVAALSGRGRSAPPSKSAQQKRAEIVEGYRRRMDELLRPHRNDPETFRAKKAELLREFSIEVSSNVFFGPEEVREVIRDLAHYGGED